MEINVLIRNFCFGNLFATPPQFFNVRGGGDPHPENRVLCYPNITNFFLAILQHILSRKFHSVMSIVFVLLFFNASCFPIVHCNWESQGRSQTKIGLFWYCSVFPYFCLCLSFLIVVLSFFFHWVFLHLFQLILDI